MSALHRFVEHMGELQLEIEAATEAEVFAQAADALAELVDGGRGVPATEELEVEGDDAAALLEAWLSDLLFLAETKGFVPEEVVELEHTGKHVRAKVHGRTARPHHLVKAVTHHDLAFEERNGHWFARLVLDV